MSGYKHKKHKYLAFNFENYSRKIAYCYFNKPVANIIELPSQSDSKSHRIQELISNIYIYKFPPILNWPEGVYIDIPVDFIIAIRKMFEHSSEIILKNIKELCFSLNAEYSSYGEGVIIIPIEYLIAKYDKNIFLDIFAHELGHALAEELLEDKKTRKQIQGWHKIIKYYSIKYKENIFHNPGKSELSLADYQLADYKEFFCELFSQIMNYYDELIDHCCKIRHDEAQIAYLNTIDLLVNYVEPILKPEREELIACLSRS